MDQCEIIRHIKAYARTGIISDELIPFFDQYGKWRGDSIGWKQPISDSHLSNIRKSHLAESRRIKKCRGGPILLTSWYVRRKEDQRVHFTKIRGSLVANSKWPLYAPALRIIGGHFYGPTKHQIRMPFLISVGGHFDTTAGFLVHAPRLKTVAGNMKTAEVIPPSLESVGGSLCVLWAFDFHAPRLKSVGRALIPYKAERVRVPLLESIGGGFLLNKGIKRIDAPMLKSIGDDFLAGSCPLIWAFRLRSVGGDMDTRSDSKYYHPDICVGGDWTCNPDAIHYWVARTKALEVLKGRDCDLEL